MKQNITIKKALELAVKYFHNKMYENAEKICQKIIKQFPNNPQAYSEALHLLGLIYAIQDNNLIAIQKIKEAIQKNPNEALYYHNLAMIYDKLGNEKNALDYFLKAIKTNQNYVSSHIAFYNIAIYYQNNNQPNKALEYFNESIKRKKDFYDAIFNRSLILLKNGDYLQGFKEFESRFYKVSPTDTRKLDKPKLIDQEVNNKKILILHEQGFGDNMQFIRYIKLLKEKRAFTILETKKELLPLFQNIKEIDKIISKENQEYKNIDYDYYIYIMSIPNYFKTELNSIPNITPYLFTDKEQDKKYKAIINEKILNKSIGKIKVGIAWKGNPKQDNDQNRSIKLEDFNLLKANKSIQLFSLQLNRKDDEKIDEKIIDLAPYLKDFSDTASIIKNLDLIICVDTSIAHLAGALNKQTFLILSNKSDWRWLKNINYSPWYHSIKIFRQKSINNYEEVFNEISMEINKLPLSQQ